MTRKMIGLRRTNDGLYLLDSQLLDTLSTIKRDISSRSNELLA